MGGDAAGLIPYTPRPPQDEIHAALDGHRFVVLVAHRRMGKTVCVINHLIRRALGFRGERGFFAYIAPFRNQAKAIAWPYLKRFTAGFPDRRVNETELSVTLPVPGGSGGGAGPERAAGTRKKGGKSGPAAEGAGPAEAGAAGEAPVIRIFGADNPDALRGLYFDGVVLDEVAQMKPEVWSEILRPALADRQGFAVFIGTPKGINLFHELYEAACRDASGQWHAALYRADETGAIPEAELAAVRSELSENAWRQEFLCDFTAASDDALIPIDLVIDAAGREVRKRDVAGQPLVLGVDVARFGADATVFQLRQGLYAFEPVVLRGLDNMAVADRLAACMAEHRPDAVFVDAGGGAGVIDRARQLGWQVTEAPFGGRAVRDGLFVNRRAEMWCACRDWLRAGGAIPDNAALKADLSTPLYSYDEAGRLKLESKDKIKERLGRSPDLADALALTFYAPVRPLTAGRGPSRVKTCRPAFQQWR